MLKEPVTNVKPIGNELVKSVTDRFRIGNGLLKSVTDNFVLETHVEQVFYVPDLAKKNWSVVMPGKKGFWGLKMLLRRRNTTSLMKFHPLTLHTSPNSWDLTKHRTCKATIAKKSIYRNQGRKIKPNFC
jgi:hypothetical protein